MRNNCSQTGNSLIDYLNELHDTRKSRGKRHSLALCIVLLFLGLMDNVCSVRGTAKYIHSPFRKKELTEVLTPYFDLSHGLPEYSTLNRVLCDVPKEELATLLCLWSVDLIYGDAAQIVWGVDGQAIRAACNKALTGKNLYVG